jgi:xanthine dehydrogenase accessory factor
VNDVLPFLERWAAEGIPVATATVVAKERSAPRDPGAVLAVSERGDVAGSVTGGCVEPAVYEEAREVLAGGAPRLKTYGIADDEAFEVGLPCGGTVHIFVDRLDAELVAPLSDAIADERPVALVTTLSGTDAGRKRLVFRDAADGDGDGAEAAARELLIAGETGIVEAAGERLFVSSFAPRPRMYVFGAVDHAAAVARIGRFLGYRVTVCDARSRFVTRERFPDADDLVTAWPDEFLRSARVDERTAIIALTHDEKFDVPLLAAAVATPARYIGAMGSRRTTERRRSGLREAGVTDEALERIHAPIGLPIGARTPEEVAVAVAAQLIEVMRTPAATPARTEAVAA